MNRERCSLVEAALDVDLASVGLDDPGRDRQPEAGAGRPARGTALDAVVTVPDVRELIRRDTAAVVRHAEQVLAVDRRGRDYHPPAGRGVFDRVLDQVAEGLDQPDLVALKRQLAAGPDR